MTPSPYQALLWTVPAKAESAIIMAEKEQGQLGAWPCPWPGQRMPQTLHMCHIQGKEQNHSGTLPCLMPEWEPRAISEVPFKAPRPHKLPSKGKTASHPGDTQPPPGPLPPPHKAANTLSPNLAPALAPLTPCLPRWQCRHMTRRRCKCAHFRSRAPIKATGHVETAERCPPTRPYPQERWLLCLISYWQRQKVKQNDKREDYVSNERKWENIRKHSHWNRGK